MSIAKTVKQYLDNKHVIYDVLEVPHFESPLQASKLAGIPPRSLYYPVVLRDPFGLMMAVLPASHKLDHQRLAGMLHRKVEPAFQTQLSSVFADCQPGHIPPLGEAYGIRTIIDANLATPEEVYIVAGDHSRLIKLSRKDFILMQSNAWLGNNFSKAVTDMQMMAVEEGAGAQAKDNNFFIRERVEQLTELPPMPEMASKIFQLQARPESDVADLSKIIELDPSLSVQVMRYANSPFFGYRGEVNNLQTAIARILGYDMVMNLALGLAVAKPFKIPRHGVIGLDACWQHSIYSANLMQMLCKAMPLAQRPRVATCYLIGLLHDFGYMVLGHLFREAFLGLNDLLSEEKSDQPIEIEYEYLGMDHGELGSWLLKAWHLPDEVVVAVREHHNEAYSGPFAPYVQLTRLSNYLLRIYESQEVVVDDLPMDAVTALGLDEVKVMEIMSQLMEGDEGLKDMARRLAA